MKPPYEITSKILELISSISEQIGEIKAARLIKPPTELRKRNRIKTIQSSLEIEGNTLTIEQITDLINNKRVLAPKKDILEVKNAIQVYSKLDTFDAYKLDSLCAAHKLLMNGLIDNPGQLRNTSVGIVKGEDLAHIAPPGEMVYPLIKDLFDYLKNDKDLPLIKSCVFHYEFEFIHPFSDGNGRISRVLTNFLLLKSGYQYMPYISHEKIIEDNKPDYYMALRRSQKSFKKEKEDIIPWLDFFLTIFLKQSKMAIDLLSEDNIEDSLSVKQLAIWQYFQTVTETTPKDICEKVKIARPTINQVLNKLLQLKRIERIGSGRSTRYRKL